MDLDFNTDKRNLYLEVYKFKNWAKENYPERNEKNDNGEWELGCTSNFDEMCDAARHIFKSYDSSDATNALVDALLYTVARDNECEILADELIQYGEWFSLLAEKSLESKYINAQWQFAKRIGKCDSCDNNLIFKFIESSDEYTSRMSLQTMAEIYPEKAEKYAVCFWNRGIYETGTYEDEYQKIMVLHVLRQIKSPLLEDYIAKSMELDYKYLIENAEEIKAMINEND